MAQRLRAVAAGLLVACGSREPLREPPPDPRTDSRAEPRATDGGIPAREAPPAAPRWVCRITAGGRPIGGPYVPEGPGFTREATVGERWLLRAPAWTDAGAPWEGGIALELRGLDGGVRVLSRAPAVPNALPMLFHEGEEVGLAFWLGRVLSTQRSDQDAGESLVLRPDEDPMRPCDAVPSDAPRWTATPGVPWEFPPVVGVPFLGAPARWTFSRDGVGLCVSELEAEGPWGHASLRSVGSHAEGKLFVAAAVHQVECAPGEAPPYVQSAREREGQPHDFLDAATRRRR